MGCDGSDGDGGGESSVGGATSSGGNPNFGGSFATGGKYRKSGRRYTQGNGAGAAPYGTQATGGVVASTGSEPAGGIPSNRWRQSNRRYDRYGWQQSDRRYDRYGWQQSDRRYDRYGRQQSDRRYDLLRGGNKATGGTTATGGTSAVGGSSGALPKFVGNITTGNSVDTGGMTYSKYWNQITPENQGKWGSVQSSASGSFNWGSLDSIYNYAQTNGIIFKQHVFVWGAQQPSGTPTLAQVENWIKSFCARYPNTKLIDVVNEPPPHTTPSYTSNLGAGEKGSWPWITKAFKLARQYCPNAILILNDYNNIEYADQEQHFIDIVKDIKANGAPIDAVGCQAHGLRGKSASTLQANLNKMATDTGLPLYITEYDIGDNDSNQLSNFQAHFPVFLNTTAVKGITVWGWINGRTWITDSGLVNGTSPRPAMTWLMGQLKRPVPPN